MRHVSMVAKFLGLNKPWPCKCGREKKNEQNCSLRNKTVAHTFLLSLENANGHLCHSLSIRRFWGKGERWKRKRERGEGEKRLTQMLLLEPSTPTQHDSIPSNQNHLRSGRAPVLVLLRFRFFLKPPMRSFRILVM